MVTREGGGVRRMREKAGPATAASARARWGEAGERIRSEVGSGTGHAATRRDRKEDIVERWSTQGMHVYMIT